MIYKTLTLWLLLLISAMTTSGTDLMLPKALKALTYQPPAFYLKYTFNTKPYEGLSREDLIKISQSCYYSFPTSDDFCDAEEMEQISTPYSPHVDDLWRISCDLFPVKLCDRILTKEWQQHALGKREMVYSDTRECFEK